METSIDYVPINDWEVDYDQKVLMDGKVWWKNELLTRRLERED